jgi:hypothetical protein
MKRKLKLNKLWEALPEETREALLATEGFSIDDPEMYVKRIGVVCEVKALEPGSRTVERYVSTRDVDRDMEVLDPAGAILDQFKLAPQVLWAHDYSLPPTAKDLWIRADEYGIKARSQYATTERAEEVFQLIQGGFLNTSSVGFIPLKRVWKGDAEWGGLVSKLNAKWQTDLEKAGAQVITTKWIMIEHSDVPVPANPNALNYAVSKGLALSDAMLAALQVKEAEEIEEETEETEAQVEPEPTREPDIIPVVRRVDSTPAQTPVEVRPVTIEQPPIVVRRIDIAPSLEQLATKVAHDALNQLRGRV